MSDLKSLGLDGRFNKLDSRPPEGAKPAASVMTLEATVSGEMQKLRTLRPFASACAQIPSLLPAEAVLILQLLFDVFSSKGIQEGQVKDLIFGFENTAMQLPPGVPKAVIASAGILMLGQYGYFTFSYEDNSNASSTDTNFKDAFVRYTPKLMELVYESPAS